MPNNVISNSGSPPNPNVWWQPTAAATAPVAYGVNLGQPTAGSAATTTWYPAYFPSAYEVDTSPDGVTWSTQLSFSSNTASRTDVFPNGQVTARYLRLPITAFEAAGQRLQWGTRRHLLVAAFSNTSSGTSDNFRPQPMSDMSSTSSPAETRAAPATAPAMTSLMFS
jgi:hypothetical protein